LRILGHGKKAAVRRQPRRLHSLWYFDVAKDSDMPFIVFVSALATWQEIGSNPSPAWQTDSSKKSKARLLVLSEKLQFPGIGHARCTTMLEKQIDEIR
jgi:hypothetical protein